jgi:translation initiation factor 2 beta subunit (eIF-2beta)/eIF-5
VLTIIRQVDEVADHFNYTDEYIMDHSLSWLKRKYSFAMNKQKDRLVQSQRSTFSAIQAVVSSFMGSKVNIDEILIPQREPSEAEKHLTELLESLKEGNTKVSGVNEEGFVVDEWWKTT